MLAKTHEVGGICACSVVALTGLSLPNSSIDINSIENLTHIEKVTLQTLPLIVIIVLIYMLLPKLKYGYNIFKKIFIISLLFLIIKYFPNIENPYILITYSLFFLGGLLGSLLPDIDKKESKIGIKLWFISWPIFIVQKIVNTTIKDKNNSIRKAVNHRGIAHWLTLDCLYIVLVFILAVTKNFVNQYFIFKYYDIVFAILLNFLIGVCFGILSHIILDLFNPSGLPLLAPFSMKRYSIGNIVTNSSEEKTFRIKLVILTFILTTILIIKVLNIYTFSIQGIINLIPCEIMKYL